MDNNLFLNYKLNKILIIQYLFFKLKHNINDLLISLNNYILYKIKKLNKNKKIYFIKY